MNREIKFRAFIAGVMKPIAILHNTPHPARVLDMDFDTNHVNATLFPVETPVMQFTGLKDKNGIEIYEGDILAHTGDTSLLKWVVIFKNGCFGVQNIHIDGSTNYNEFWPINSEYFLIDREVIGTIHNITDLIK